MHSQIRPFRSVINVALSWRRFHVSVRCEIIMCEWQPVRCVRSHFGPSAVQMQPYARKHVLNRKWRNAISKPGIKFARSRRRRRSMMRRNYAALTQHRRSIVNSPSAAQQRLDSTWGFIDRRQRRTAAVPASATVRPAALLCHSLWLNNNVIHRLIFAARLVAVQLNSRRTI
jgi:hypothetical protein